MSDPDQAEAEFHAALGAVVDAWQLVEMALCDVLETVLRSPDGRVAAEIFYAVANFRDKLGMVDAAVSFTLLGNKSALAEWKTLRDRISDKSKRRNAIVHSHTRHEVEGTTSTYALYPPYRFSEHAPPAKRITTLKQLREVKTSFNLLAAAIQQFRRLARASSRPPQ